MVQRGSNEPIDDQVVENREQAAGGQRSLDAACQGRLSLNNRQHAHRDEWTILTTVAFLPSRTAGHIARHCGHIGQLGNRRPLCSRGGHQRRRNKPSIPGTASPTAAGPFSNNWRIADAGTWPSMTYPQLLPYDTLRAQPALQAASGRREGRTLPRPLP
jgi:hypothetical protein